jgi:hypothetical protein
MAEIASSFVTKAGHMSQQRFAKMVFAWTIANEVRPILLDIEAPHLSDVSRSFPSGFQIVSRRIIMLAPGYSEPLK